MGCAPPPGFSRASAPASSDVGAGAPPSLPVARATGGLQAGTRFSGSGRCGCPRPREHRRPAGNDGAGRPAGPPTSRGPRLCPTREATIAIGAGSGRTGVRSARGYPAPVSAPPGADPAVVGPYLARVLGDERWRSVRLELIAAGLSN